jgi:hypothetical protein
MSILIRNTPIPTSAADVHDLGRRPDGGGHARSVGERGWPRTAARWRAELRGIDPMPAGMQNPGDVPVGASGILQVQAKGQRTGKALDQWQADLRPQRGRRRRMVETRSRTPGGRGDAC